MVWTRSASPVRRGGTPLELSGETPDPHKTPPVSGARKWKANCGADRQCVTNEPGRDAP